MDISKERGGGADPNPNFLRNFLLLEMRSTKKVPQTCPNLQGAGVKAVQQKSKVKLVFLVGASHMSGIVHFTLQHIFTCVKNVYQKVFLRICFSCKPIKQEGATKI